MTPAEHYRTATVLAADAVERRDPLSAQLAQVHAFLAMAADLIGDDQ